MSNIPELLTSSTAQTGMTLSDRSHKSTAGGAGRGGTWRREGNGEAGVAGTRAVQCSQTAEEQGSPGQLTNQIEINPQPLAIWIMGFSSFRAPSLSFFVVEMGGGAGEEKKE